MAWSLIVSIFHKLGRFLRVNFDPFGVGQNDVEAKLNAISLLIIDTIFVLNNQIKRQEETN